MMAKTIGSYRRRWKCAARSTGTATMNWILKVHVAATTALRLSWEWAPVGHWGTNILKPCRTLIKLPWVFPSLDARNHRSYERAVLARRLQRCKVTMEHSHQACMQITHWIEEPLTEDNNDHTPPILASAHIKCCGAHTPPDNAKFSETTPVEHSLSDHRQDAAWVYYC